MSMDRERWIAVRAIVEAAIDRPPETRDAFLDAECGGDAELRAEVEELLRFESSSSSLGSSSALPPLGRPAEVGPYRIIDLLGEGGFGSVYRAEQTEPVRRQVALKLLRPGLDSKDVLARFDAERHALARMNHPNIARVFDAGETSDGRPYFVMELADGKPITSEADDRSLSLRRRIELFLPVCRAIQHSHTKGVVHRDLKPSNILVVEEDGRPTAKVIDFGIAKATGGKLGDFTIVTQQQIIGTPAYMSPEQADPRSDVDSRTDVYSLGAVLYELLTGARPFDDETLMRDGPTGLPKILAEQDPTKPSTRVRSASRDETTCRIGVDSRALSRGLAGDLDWVLLKALEKDRERRYQTPQALADDLEHYLRLEPVSAGPPTASYKLRKMARRHRLALGVTFLLVVFLSAGLVLMWLGKQEAESQRNIARLERNRAQRSLYFAEMNLAGQSIRENSGVAGIRRLLERWATPDDAFDPRGWEYRFLDRLAHEEHSAFDYGGTIQHVDAHPSRALLAVGVGHVFLQDLETGERLQQLPIEGGGVSQVAWSPAGDRLAAATGEGTVVWSAETWERLATFKSSEHPCGVVTWHPDGERVAFQDFYSRRLCIGDVRIGEITHEVTEGLIDDTTRPSFSADGALLAYGGHGGDVFVLDVERWELVRRFHAQQPPVYVARFSPDGLLATAGVDPQIRLWDPLSGELITELVGHDKRVTDLAWSRDGRLASTSWDYTVRIWSPETGDTLARLRGPMKRVTGIAWSVDDREIFASSEDGKITSWQAGGHGAARVHRELELPSWGSRPHAHWLSSDRIVGTTGSAGTRAWARSNAAADIDGALPPAPYGTLSHDGRFAAYAPDGPETIILDWPAGTERRRFSRLASAHESILSWHPTEPFVAWCATHELIVEHATDPTLRWRTTSIDGRALRGFAWSPTGDRIALADEHTVRILDRHGADLGVVPVASRAWSLDWSPDGREIAVPERDQICRIIDVETRTIVRELRGHSYALSAVDWHPDGSRIATAAQDGSVRLWDAASGQPILRLAITGSGAVVDLDWSPDGECLAGMTSWGIMHLWDAGGPGGTEKSPP